MYCTATATASAAKVPQFSIGMASEAAATVKPSESPKACGTETPVSEKTTLLGSSVNKGNNRRTLPLTHSIFSVTVSVGLNST